MALKDTLERRRKIESTLNQSISNQEYIDEWQDAVDDFLNRVQEFLREYKEDGSLQFELSKMQITEETLGSYDIGHMILRAPGSAVVMIEPVGRTIIGAVGRVDIYRQGHVAKGDRIMALRHDPDLNWELSLPPETEAFRIMSTEALARSLKRTVVPFTKENLEAALDRLLQ